MTTPERRIQTLLRRAGTARSWELVAASITRSHLSRMVAVGQMAAHERESSNLAVLLSPLLPDLSELRLRQVESFLRGVC